MWCLQKFGANLAV